MTQNVKDNLPSVFILTSSLGGGGAERTIATLVSRLEARFTLLVREDGKNIAFSIPSHVSIRKIPSSNIGTFIALRRILVKERPDIVFSVFTKNNLILLCVSLFFKKKTRIVISERTTFTAAVKEMGNSIKKIVAQTVIPIAMRLLYVKADKIVAVSEGVARDLRCVVGNLSNIWVVNNPIDIDSIYVLAREREVRITKKQTSVVIAMGRLVPAKDYQTLIKAFAKVQENSILWILGKGAEEDSLRGLACSLGIQKRVCFLGFQKNPYVYLVKADVFVLSSIREGFPNALVEAMALGIPCVATNCTSGPGEIIEHMGDGLLVNPGNDRQLAEAINLVLGDENFGKKLGENGRRRAQDFSVDIILERYKKIFSLERQ